MKGIKGTVKMIGDPCAMCLRPITADVAVHRSPPREGILSYCRTCRNLRSVQAHQRNPSKKLDVNRLRRHRLKMEVIQGYGGKCECCGETAPEFLAIDHRHGGGSQHRRTVTSPTELRRLIIKQGFPAEYRILCHNCNSAIGWFGNCPHARS